MAMDGDAAPAIVEAEVSAAVQENQELPPFDESKLIRGKKGNVLRPTRPDDVERNIQIEKLDAEIKKHSDRMAEIKALQQSMRTRGPNPEQAEHRRRKDELQAAWNMTLKQKMAIREEFNRANTERDIVRSEIRETRGKIPRGTKLETLEADIQAAEYKLEHESLSAADEKRAQQYIQSLTAARPLSRQILMMEEKLKLIEAARTASKVRLDSCDATLSSIKEREQVESAALDAIRKQREEATVDLPALEVEKQECWEVGNLLRAKRNEIREAFNQKWQEYQELNKNYLIWVKHDKKAQFEERQKARDAREADRAQAETGQAPSAPSEPYDTEIFTVDMLLVYLRKFQASEESAASKPAEEVQLEVPKGCLPMKKKEEDMSFFAKVEKKPKKGQAPKDSSLSSASSSKQPAEPAAAKGKKINHTLDILQSFMSVGLEVPSSTLDVPSSIEKAEAKKVEYLEKREKVKEGPVATASAPVTSAAELEPEAEAEAEAEAEPPSAADAEEPEPEPAPEPEPVPEPTPEVEAVEPEVIPEPEVVEPLAEVAKEPVVEEVKEPEPEAPAAVKEAEAEPEEAAPAPTPAPAPAPAPASAVVQNGGVGLTFSVAEDERVKLTFSY